jgi:hypothetical protein
MPAFDYGKTSTTALRLLTKFGQSVILARQSTGTYDPALGAAPVTETLETRKAVLLDYDRINFGETLQDGTRVQAGDRRCLMGTDGSPPTNFDAVIVGSERYPIKVVKELNPAGTPVLYDMLIRK